MRDKEHNCNTCGEYRKTELGSRSACQVAGVYIKDLEDCPLKDHKHIVPIKDIVHWISVDRTKEVKASKRFPAISCIKDIREEKLLAYEAHGTCGLNAALVTYLFDANKQPYDDFRKNIRSQNGMVEMRCPLCAKANKLRKERKFNFYMKRAAEMKERIKKFLLTDKLSEWDIVNIHDACVRLGDNVNKKVVRMLYYYKRLVAKAIYSLNGMNFRREKMQEFYGSNVSYYDMVRWFEIKPDAVIEKKKAKVKVA